MEKYDPIKVERLKSIRNLIHENVPLINEKLWTKVPCFYIDNKSIVLRVFADYVTIFADPILLFKEELMDYVITQKGVLLIYEHQALPMEVLTKVFRLCFNNN
jgi:hypothetical protein